MADREEFGTPQHPVPPSGNQPPEPSPWHLLYDLNATIARVDEAVTNLKDRTASVDTRVENMAKELDKLSGKVEKISGSILTLKWVFGLLVPLGTTLLIMIAKHFGL